MPEPSKSDLFFDLESSVWAYEEKLEYLFGIWYQENGKQNYLPLWAHNKEDEKKNLIKCQIVSINSNIFNKNWLKILYSNT